MKENHFQLEFHSLPFRCDPNGTILYVIEITIGQLYNFLQL